MNKALKKFVDDVALVAFSSYIAKMGEKEGRYTGIDQAELIASFVQHSAVPFFKSCGLAQEDWIAAIDNAQKVLDSAQKGEPPDGQTGG